MKHREGGQAGVGVPYREDRPFLGILITSFTHSQGISMQMILKGHAVREDRVPNGVYKQRVHTQIGLSELQNSFMIRRFGQIG